MNIRELNRKSKSCSSSESQSAASDSQTVEHGSKNNEYLLSKLKMKNSALNKALNMIEILQLELEVEKNSKKEAVLLGQQQIREYYQTQISILRSHMLTLENTIQKQNTSTNDINPKCDCKLMRSSSYSKSMNRSKSNRSLSPLKQKYKQELSLESKIYRKMILESGIWDSAFIQNFQQIIDIETKSMRNWIQKLDQINNNFEKQLYMYGNITKKSKGLLKCQQMGRVIQQLCSTIENMKIYQKQLEDMISGAGCRLSELGQQIYLSSSITPSCFEQVKADITEMMGNLSKQREIRGQKLREQNKQLREIIQELITLINKKKLNVVI